MTIVRIKSVPRGGDAGLVGRVGRLGGVQGRRRLVRFSDGTTTALMRSRLENTEPYEALGDVDPFAAAAQRWVPVSMWDGSAYRFPPKPTAKFLRGEVEAIGLSYADTTVQYRRGDGTLVVTWTTPSVTLEGVALGRFRVELSVRCADPYGTIFVNALEPNRPRRNPDITHPHVRDDEICLGEGEESFGVAVESGRLADAADVVWSVLRTWSPDTCFGGIHLDTWDYFACPNCLAAVPTEPTPSGCPQCAPPPRRKKNAPTRPR